MSKKNEDVIFAVGEIGSTKDAKFIAGPGASHKYDAVLAAVGKLKIGMYLKVPVPVGMDRNKFFNNLSTALQKAKMPDGCVLRKGGLADGSIGIRCVSASEVKAKGKKGK